jgi:hypothetical protein
MAPELPAAIDGIERAVCDALVRLDKYCRRVPKTDAAWTRAVKDAVGSIGHELGHRIYACSSRFERNGEWVFDLVWCKMRGEVVVDVPLALESEWTPNGAMDDFQKLLISRARHRVMVLWSWRRPSAERVIGSLIRQVAKYRGSQRGDRYLFCCWVENPAELLFQSYVVKHQRSNIAIVSHTVGSPL